MVEKDSRPITRRRIVKGLGAGAGVALAGCMGGGDTTTSGGDTTTSGEGGDTTTSDGGDGGSGESPLLWIPWMLGSGNTSKLPRQYFKNQFNSSHEYDVKVGTFTYMDARKKFLTGARTGQPDAIEGLLSHRAEYAFADLLEDLGPYVENLEYFNGFKDPAIEAGKVKGSLVALPYTGNARALVYRKDIFNDLGLEPPTTGKEFLEVGRAIKDSDHDIVPYHNCTKKGSVRSFQEWISHVYQTIDGQLYEFKDGSWTMMADAEDLGKIFDTWYYQVYAADNPVGDPDDKGTGWQANDPGYLNGRYAMIPCGPWIRKWTSGENITNSERTKTILNEKTRIAPLPYPKGGTNGTFFEVKFYMMNKYSKTKDRAWEAMKYLASPEYLNNAPAYYNATPIHDDVKADMTSPDWSAFKEAIPSGTALAPIKWGEVRKAYYENMQQVVWGRTDPYKAGEQLHASLKKLEDDVGMSN